MSDFAELLPETDKVVATQPWKMYVAGCMVGRVKNARSMAVTYMASTPRKL